MAKRPPSTKRTARGGAAEHDMRDACAAGTHHGIPLESRGGRHFETAIKSTRSGTRTSHD